MSAVNAKRENKLSHKHELFELLTGKKLLKPERRYNWMGLRFSSEYVNTVGGFIGIFPLKIVAGFNTQYSKECVDFDNRFAIKSFIEEIKSTDYKIWMAEDLGLLAYIILKRENDEIKKSASEVYQLYKVYLENRILHILGEVRKQEQNYL